MADGKRCARCGETKPPSAFPPGKKWRDGLFPYCRECKRAADRADYAKHKPERDAANRARYVASPERQKAKARARYRSDPVASKAHVAAWRAANPDKVRAYSAKWVQDNLGGAVRENVRRRYARRKGASTVRFTPEQLRQKVAYWGDRCWMCHGPHEAIDHVKPLSKGGAHMLANLRPICTACNSKKRAAWPLTTQGALMVHSPSHRWENGVLVERAISTIHDEDAEAEEIEPQATKPYKTPVPTLSATNRKRVESAENKAVAPAKASKKAAKK